MTEGYQTRIKKAITALNEAEFVLIGGGAGLSAAAGLTYEGKRFTDHFAPFITRYGFKDLYSSSFYPFETQEENWAYWAKHISLNRYETAATPLYTKLFRIMHDKQLFVISTNVESQFTKSGFPTDKVFEIQGDYGFLQCATACHDKLYYNEKLVREMVKQTIDCKVPSSLVPVCPECGGAMDVNLRKNQFFVQDEAWYEFDKRYKSFLEHAVTKNLVLIELGVGFNTPGIIRYPFERITHHAPNVTLIRLNQGHPEGFDENKSKTISFTENMDHVISDLLKNKIEVSTWT